MPFCFNLKIIPSCYTLSNAFNISRKLLRTSNPSSNDLYISCVIDKSWLTQVSPSLKADWFCKLRLFLIKNGNISLNSKRSRILKTVCCFSCEKALRSPFSIQMEKRYSIYIHWKLVPTVYKYIFHKFSTSECWSYHDYVFCLNVIVELYWMYYYLRT